MAISQSIMMAAVVIMSMLVSSSHCAPMSGESMPKESTEEALVAGEMMRQLFTNAEAARQQQQQAVDENLRELGLALLRKASSGTRSQSKRAAAMGVDLPDYILHLNKGRNFDFSQFREKLQKSG